VEGGGGGSGGEFCSEEWFSSLCWGVVFLLTKGKQAPFHQVQPFLWGQGKGQTIHIKKVFVLDQGKTFASPGLSLNPDGRGEVGIRGGERMAVPPPAQPLGGGGSAIRRCGRKCYSGSGKKKIRTGFHQGPEAENRGGWAISKRGWTTAQALGGAGSQPRQRITGNSAQLKKNLFFKERKKNFAPIKKESPRNIG